MTSALKEFVEARVRLLTTRHGHRITRIDVTLLDINGPKGGVDKRCRVRLKLQGRPSLVIQETNADMYEAINACAYRLKRAVKKQFERAHNFQPSHKIHNYLLPELNHGAGAENYASQRL